MSARVGDVSGVWEWLRSYRVKNDGSIIDNLMSNCDRSSFVAMGHSFGGGTAYTATGLEGCKAAVCFDPWLDAYKWSPDFKGWQVHGSKPVLFLTADKGFISRGGGWRRQLEAVEEMEGNVRAVRFNGSDHIDVSDVPLCTPFRYDADGWFIENVYEAKEFLKGAGFEVEEGVEREIERRREDKFQVMKTFQAPW